jgi:hypothetical protein
MDDLISLAASLVGDQATAERVVAETIATLPPGQDASFARRAVENRARSLLRHGGYVNRDVN